MANTGEMKGGEKIVRQLNTVERRQQLIIISLKTSNYGKNHIFSIKKQYVNIDKE